MLAGTSPRAPLTTRPRAPAIAVSGVRNSWLTVATNSDLSRSMRFCSRISWHCRIRHGGCPSTQAAPSWQSMVWPKASSRRLSHCCGWVCAACRWWLAWACSLAATRLSRSPCCSSLALRPSRWQNCWLMASQRPCGVSRAMPCGAVTKAWAKRWRDSSSAWRARSCCCAARSIRASRPPMIRLSVQASRRSQAMLAAPEAASVLRASSSH